MKVKNELFSHIKHQQHELFLKNPLIQEIASERQWTVSHENSDGAKVPTDAKKLIETGYIDFAYLLKEPYPLISLSLLDEGIQNLKEQNIPYESNRAYRLQSNLNRVIMIDIEPEAPDEMLEFGAKFPANYTEISQNGGVHLLIKVPEDLITVENEYLFDLTVVKEDVKDDKLPPETDDQNEKLKPRPASYEVLLNDHFITFTKKMLKDKPIADFENNEKDREKLKKFLNSVVEMDRERQERREAISMEEIEINTDDIDMDAVMQIFNSTPRRTFILKQKEKSVMDFANDTSRYEISIATACAGHLYQFREKLATSKHMKDHFSHLKDSDYIYLTQLMLEAIVPKRKKHHEKRDGLPWLMYLSKNGWGYIQSQNENN